MISRSNVKDHIYEKDAFRKKSFPLTEKKMFDLINVG